MTDEIVKNSGVVEMSMRITKASYNKSDDTPRHWTAIDSDVDEDLYKEKMSIELYKDFVERIENNTPVPEPFKDVICEDDWCGGVPYLSIAHYKAGDGLKNVPGVVKSVFIDGTRLKSKGTLNDTEMGRRVFDALCTDYKKKSESDHQPVRISIGFLDLEHKHLSDVGGQEFTFARTDVGQICPLCAQGIGGKIYTKGQLVHLAMTRVPVNPRTEMSVEKSMDITTKKDDAKSIIGELADELEEKSIAGDVLVVRADSDDVGSSPRPDPSELTPCYYPDSGDWDQECINKVMDRYLVKMKSSISAPVKSETAPRELLDALWKSVETLYKSNGYEVPVVEDKMDNVISEKEVTPEVAKVEEVVAAPVAEVKAEKSATALDAAFEALKARVADGKGGNVNVEEINRAFAELGTAVEKEFAPAPKAFDPSDLAAIVKSAVESAVQPLRIELATLKAAAINAPAQTGNTVKSKALTIGGYTREEDLIKRAVVSQTQPAVKRTQIEEIARRSTGADR